MLYVNTLKRLINKEVSVDVGKCHLPELDGVCYTDLKVKGKTVIVNLKLTSLLNSYSGSGAKAFYTCKSDVKSKRKSKNEALSALTDKYARMIDRTRSESSRDIKVLITLASDGKCHVSYSERLNSFEMRALSRITLHLN